MIDLWNSLHPVVQGLLKGLAVICVIFPIAGACSMAERKVSAWIQGRYGPNRVMVPWFAWVPFLGRGLQRLGVFNLLADGGKLLFKEDPLPGHVNKFYFMIAPAIAIIPAFTTVTVVPFGAYLDAGRAGRAAHAGQRRRRPARGLRDRVARHLLDDPRRLGLQLEVSVPRQRARLGAAHLLRAFADALGAAGLPLGQRAGHRGLRSASRARASSMPEPARHSGAACGSSS